MKEKGEYIVNIDASVKTEFVLKMCPHLLYDILQDVEQSGLFIPNVETVRLVGANQFEWCLAERRVFSKTFKGHYVTEYMFEAEKISWITVNGNMESSGQFLFTPSGSGVRLFAEMKNCIPLDVPPLVRPVVQAAVEQQILNAMTCMFKKVENSVARAGDVQ